MTGLEREDQPPISTLHQSLLYNAIFFFLIHNNSSHESVFTFERHGIGGKSGDCSYLWPLRDWEMALVGFRVTTQGDVRHGCNVTLLVLLGSHAVRRGLIPPKLSFVSPISLKRGNLIVKMPAFVCKCFFCIPRLARPWDFSSRCTFHLSQKSVFTYY